jgi:uncharacterized cofD-like protein
MTPAEPRIVVIGGGTGCPTLMEGLRRYTTRLTAVVTVMDSGGSSGRLRQELGVPALGDLRRCLVAQADHGSGAATLAGLFEHRFESKGPLDGHSQGNLLLASLMQTHGGLQGAVDAAAELLGVTGAVLPVTLESAELRATLMDGTVMEGEAALDQRGASPVGVRRVDLDHAASANPRAITAIQEADAVILAPGDLFTSLLPNLLVDGMPEAIRSCQGRRIYVSNLATKPGETDGYRLSDFVREINSYLGSDEPLDLVLAQRGEQASPSSIPLPEGYAPVEADVKGCREVARLLVLRHVARDDAPGLHDPTRTAQAIMELLAAPAD